MWRVNYTFFEANHQFRHHRGLSSIIFAHGLPLGYRPWALSGSDSHHFRCRWGLQKISLRRRVAKWIKISKSKAARVNFPGKTSLINTKLCILMHCNDLFTKTKLWFLNFWKQLSHFFFHITLHCRSRSMWWGNRNRVCKTNPETETVYVKLVLKQKPCM